MNKIILNLTVIIILFGISDHVNAQDEILDLKQEKTITISAFAAIGELDKLRIELNGGLDAGLTVNEVKEILVHLYAYCGFPRSIRGLQTLMLVLDERKAKGINDNWGPEASAITDNRDKYQRGKEILAKLSGVNPPAGRATTGYASFSPEIETFLKEHLFADIFERDVLTYAQREMVTVSVLMSIGGVEPMLSSHMNLCMNVGVTPAQLIQMVRIIEINVCKKNGDESKVVLNELLQKNSVQIKVDTLARVNDKKKCLNNNSETPVQIFPQGNLIKNDFFKGTAWLQWLVTNREDFDLTIGNVLFEPGSRNNWHTHPGGQILLCTRGKGYYQEKGKSIQLLTVGDVVEISPNVIHWHGATPDSKFEHIAISPQLHKGSTVWMESVTDEEYKNYGDDAEILLNK